MKTLPSFVSIWKSAFFLLVTITIAGAARAQSGPGGGTSGNNLRFESPVLLSGAADLQPGARYLFSNVTSNVDAIVQIDSLINGAKVNKIDDNSNGTGYKEAFQPAIQSGNVTGMSYVVFKITFYAHGDTTNPKTMPVVNATALDLDGNSTLKEFGRMNMGVNTTMNYMVATPDISVSQILPGEFIGQNILGVERTGIDTTALANMFTVSNSNIASFTIKYGTITSTAANPVRQFSLYLKRFDYPGNVLPIKLASFTATLSDNNKALLKWTTASEVNLSHFVIERSTDGVHFQDAGIMFGSGSENAEASYSFPDNLAGLNATVIYYRLRSVSTTGKDEYSEIRIIRLGKSTTREMMIMAYPNPATTDIRITIPAEWQNKKLVYEVLNMGGQTVKRKETASSSQTESLSIGSLAPGVYMLRVSCEGQTGVQKIVKQ